MHYLYKNSIHIPAKLRVKLTNKTGSGISLVAILVDKLIPYVDGNFRTIVNPAHRAMCGMETHTITLNKPDVFSYYALLSGGIYTSTEIKDISKVEPIFLNCGSKERQDRVKNAAAVLKDAGFNAVSGISNNTAHEFLTWRRSLHELVPLLFKN